MLLIDCGREIFQPLASRKTYAEIGVYKGDYSLGIRKYSPLQMFLIDAWSIPNMERLVPEDSADENPQLSLENAIRHYFPNGVSNALADAFGIVTREFADLPTCKIIRKTSKDACVDFENESLDFIYLDANHRYDYVLADLERWQPKVASAGIFVLNDCYVSRTGKMQHMSVLEALSTFMKLHQWQPVAMVNRSFTDVVISRPHVASQIEQDIRNIALSNNISFIELPNQLIHSARHYLIEFELNGKKGTREYLSFGS